MVDVPSSDSSPCLPVRTLSSAIILASPSLDIQMCIGIFLCTTRASSRSRRPPPLEHFDRRVCHPAQHRAPDGFRRVSHPKHAPSRNAYSKPPFPTSCSQKLPQRTYRPCPHQAHLYTNHGCRPLQAPGPPFVSSRTAQESSVFQYVAKTPKCAIGNGSGCRRRGTTGSPLLGDKRVCAKVGEGAKRSNRTGR